MASIRRDPRNGKTWQVAFRWNNKLKWYSCGTDDDTEAQAIKARIEDRIRALKRGLLEIPPGADAGRWIFSDGKLGLPTEPERKSIELGDACKSYLDDQKDKAGATLYGEQIHTGHLKKHLGASTKLHTLNLEAMQSYVNVRLAEKNRMGGTVDSATVKKELLTFNQIWTWARQRGYVVGEAPFRDPVSRKWAVKLPKPKEHAEFVTLKEAGGDGCYVYLSETEVAELLGHVDKNSQCPHVYPMFALVAYTGIRRSEMLAALVRDVKFDTDEVVVRERKRKKSRRGSVRRVPMRPELATILRNWLKAHPDNRPDAPLITSSGDPLTRDAAHRQFKATLEGSRWDAIKGFHTLRHSFAAICVRAGIPPNVIAEMMGHTTAEMMKLYQHIFPQDMQKWMKDSFPSLTQTATA